MGRSSGGWCCSSYRFVDRPTQGRAFGLGVLAALAALTRAEGLWFIPVLLLPLAWRAGQHRLRLASSPSLGALVLLVPWTVRNYVAFHRFVPVANSGAVIAGANNRCAYYGSHIGSWQGGCAHVPGETQLSPEIDVSSKQTSQGISYATQHAARAVLVAAIRLLRVWSLYDPGYQAIGQATLIHVGLWIYYVIAIAAVIRPGCPAPTRSPDPDPDRARDRDVDRRDSGRRSRPPPIRRRGAVDRGRRVVLRPPVRTGQARLGPARTAWPRQHLLS